ncbi:MAG: FecR domain-containing protein [Rhodocyclaceae bacterium]|nr:FecR domain-containing protein [Rhodocyclaceae bacterium]
MSFRPMPGLAVCAMFLASVAAGAQTAPAAPAAVTAPPAVATPAPAAAPGADAHAGFIKSVKGEVHVLSAGGDARLARPGDRVSPIDRISTGPASAASLVLRDGTALVLGPDSRVDLKQFHFDSTTQDGGLLVSLLRGSLRMVSGLIGKTNPDAVRVDTQTATIGIRGTDFIVTADAQP